MALSPLQQKFINENKSLMIDFHPSDEKFLIIRNCDFKNGAELCKKYGSSGCSIGNKMQDFQIGNFGKY